MIDRTYFTKDELTVINEALAAITHPTDYNEVTEEDKALAANAQTVIANILKDVAALQTLPG